MVLEDVVPSRPSWLRRVVSSDQRIPPGCCRSAAGQSCLTIWSVKYRASAPTPMNSADPRDRCQERPMKYKLDTGDRPCHCTKLPCASLTSGIATHSLLSRKPVAQMTAATSAD